MLAEQHLTPRVAGAATYRCKKLDLPGNRQVPQACYFMRLPGGAVLLRNYWVGLLVMVYSIS